MNDVASASARPVVAGIGEFLWDIFPDGPRFGGAPANYACSVAALSAEFDVFMVSGVGDDQLGYQALNEFRTRGIDTSAVAVSRQPTGTVHVWLDEAGHASYRFAENTAWDGIGWTANLEDLAARTNAVCFGTLGQRSDVSRQTVQRFVSSTRADALRIFDINLRPPYFSDAVIVASLDLCNCLKLNDDELPLVAGLCSATGAGSDVLEQIARRWDLQTVALTRGAEGAALWHEGRLFESTGVKTTVIDTVGAGDSFTAALTIGLLRRTDPQAVCQWACEVAAFVCSNSGATPAIPQHLLS